MTSKILIPNHDMVPAQVVQLAKDFLDEFLCFENKQETKVVLHKDEKSMAFYLTCHLNGNDLGDNCDLGATIDTDDENESYKLNRDVLENKPAFIEMVNDALNGRSFEDIVLEYDYSYREDLPLKVYGGQHRIKAIKEALENDVNVVHGVRVYFDLTKQQKVEIALINNTSIVVSNDLLDRMSEQLVGPELREWCQQVGLLKSNQDFADRRDAVIPTVRIARTLVLNFIEGMNGSMTVVNEPIVAVSGGYDENYEELRKNIDWNDERLAVMGKEFCKLHTAQRETVNNRKTDKAAEFSRKAMSLTIVASWSFAAGLFQNENNHLDILYNIPNAVKPPKDPLNAKALATAKHKGHDPDNYRGLGTRTNPRELGRMLEVFIIMATKNKPQIDVKLANAAIGSYEAKYSQKISDEMLNKL